MSRVRVPDGVPNDSEVRLPHGLRVLYGSLVKRLRHRPLTPVTGVRFPHESEVSFWTLVLLKNGSEPFIVGVDDAEGPPVPMPNTEVKLSRAEDT